MKSMQKKVAVSLGLSQIMLLCAVVPAFSLNSAASDLLAPPIAPKYDFSANKPSSSSSSSNGSNTSSSSSGSNDSNYRSSNSADAEPPNAMNDAGKLALQQATVLYQQGKTDQAEAAFRHVLTLNVRCVDAYYNLGVIAETRGDFQSALNNYQVASRLNPDDSELHEAVNAVQTKIAQKASSEQRTHSQQQQPQQLAGQPGQQPPNTAGLKQAAADAQAAYKSGNYDKAISNLSWVASQAPNDPDVQYALSQAYKGKGDQQNARVALNRALSIDPNNNMYRTAMSQLNARGGGSGSGGGYGASQSGGGGSHSYQDETASQQGRSVPYTPYNAPFSSSNSSTGWQSASADAPTGQITPFTSQGESSLPGAHHGGVSGSGSSGFFMGTGTNGGYGTKTRLTRAALGVGAGMAVGALFGAPSHHMGRSMVTGGLIGGAVGLFSGGW